MRKTIMFPGMWGAVDSDEIDELQMSYCVATHRQGYKKVVFSGGGHDEGGIETQTRTVLEYIEDTLHEFDGTMDDVTTLRMYVQSDVLSPETQVRLHEVRAEFFEYPHYPAATMVGIDSLLHEDFLIEIEAEAEIPTDGWETDVIEQEG